MHEAVSAALEWETHDGIVAASVFGGFPYSDVRGGGASVVVVATDRQLGETCCRALSDLLWSLREDFLVELPDPATAVLMSQEKGRRLPVVLADIADNPLSGGSADTTVLLSEVLRARVPRTLVGAVCDSRVMAMAQAAGEGGEITCQLGGVMSPEYGAPLEINAKVVRVTDGHFCNSGPMNTGVEVDVDGAAHLCTNGVDILVTGRPITANDPELFKHIGLDVTHYDLLVLKVKNHFRAAFEGLVGEIIYVDAPGVASNDLSRFPFQNLPEGLWPLDPNASFSREIVSARL